jgi:surface antigen
MRPNQTAVALAALAIALPLSGPAAAQKKNPLSAIFSCDAEGGKQEGGAVIGGVVGGVVGNRVAKGERGLGTVLGAALGAAAGSYIGCRMQRSDQRKAEQAAQDALNRNRNTSWTNAETGASGDVRMISTSSGEPVSMSGLRLASGVDLAQAYDGAGGRYRARSAANLRGSPSTTAPIVGKLRPGEEIDALARVQGSNWLLAGRDGIGVGYVSGTVVNAVGGQSVCRTFDQTLRTKDGDPDTQRYTACKGANGEWVVQS